MSTELIIGLVSLSTVVTKVCDFPLEIITDDMVEGKLAI
jgi:hypothetical protein